MDFGESTLLSVNTASCAQFTEVYEIYTKKSVKFTENIVLLQKFGTITYFSR